MRYNSILTSQISKPLTQEANELLIPKVIDGDKAARDEMITGNMALVITKVNTFIREHPSATHLRDDLTSAGFIGLTEGVDALNDSIINPMGYVATAVYSRLACLLDEEMLIRIPRETRRMAKKNNHAIPVMEIYLLDDGLTLKDQQDFEMRDLIGVCCETDEEIEFVKLRELGYTLPEVAVKFNKPLVTVFRMFDSLRNRVTQKIKDST